MCLLPRKDTSKHIKHLEDINLPKLPSYGEIPPKALLEKMKESATWCLQGLSTLKTPDQMIAAGFKPVDKTKCAKCNVEKGTNAMIQ